MPAIRSIVRLQGKAIPDRGGPFAFQNVLSLRRAISEIQGVADVKSIEKGRLPSRYWIASPSQSHPGRLLLGKASPSVRVPSRALFAAESHKPHVWFQTSIEYCHELASVSSLVISQLGPLY